MLPTTGQAMITRFVRRIDNTLANDVFVVGKIYEVARINEGDGYYALSGLGQFRMARFDPVAAAEAAAGDPPRAA